MPEGTRYDLTEQAKQWTRPAPLPFGPGRPVMPEQPEDRPRIFEYAPGINLQSIPRAGFGLMTFRQLRNLAIACKEVRLNIELIKREVRALQWEIGASREDDQTDYGADIEAAQALLESPDGLHDFDAWLSAALEEMLVTDALTIWPDATMGGQVNALELVDGATIHPLLDGRGRIPPPPAPAYIQVLHGSPRSFFARDRLIYRPFNVSVASPYGTSPIEFITLAVNLALRRDVYHVGYFTEGNVPEALVGAPAEWTQQQVNTWQDYWDALVAGNVEAQRKMHWVPVSGTSGNIPVYEFTKDNMDQVTVDEWLMRVACWAFGNSPAEFGITAGQGLGGTGFVQGMENVQYRSILGPITQFIENLLTQIIQRRMGRPYLRFEFIGMDPQEDRLHQAQVDELYLRNGVYTVQYVQDRDSIPVGVRGNGPQAQMSPYGGLVPTVPPVDWPGKGASPEEAEFFRRRRGSYP